MLVIIFSNICLNLIGVARAAFSPMFSNDLSTCLLFVEYAEYLASISAIPLLFLSVLSLFLGFLSIDTNSEKMNQKMITTWVVPITGVCGIYFWYLTYAALRSFEFVILVLVASSVQYSFSVIKNKINNTATSYAIVICCSWFYQRVVDSTTTDHNPYPIIIIGYQLSVLSCCATCFFANIVDISSTWLKQAIYISMILLIMTNPLLWHLLAVMNNKCAP